LYEKEGLLQIWSSNSNAAHAPPNDLVMKNQQWPTGDSIRSFLVDADGEELAWRESKRGVGFGSGYATGIEGAVCLLYCSFLIQLLFVRFRMIPTNAAPLCRRTTFEQANEEKKIVASSDSYMSFYRWLLSAFLGLKYGSE
jgi:hypothetical protein